MKEDKLTSMDGTPISCQCKEALMNTTTDHQKKEEYFLPDQSRVDLGPYVLYSFNLL